MTTQGGQPRTRWLARVAVAASAAVFAAATVGACREPTQAELVITTDLDCAEIGEVAIIASTSPLVCEESTRLGFYATQTRTCLSPGSYGTLFLTPSGERAAVVVVAAPKGTQASRCRPPDYAGCIVARRAFTFVDNFTLHIPISLDADCRNVPCDAFSTCKKGACTRSDLVCSDEGACRLVGEALDGGLLPDAEVFVDGSTNRDAQADGASDGSPADGATDAATEADSDGAASDGGDPPTDGVSCASMMLVCPGGAPCMPPNGCCRNVMVLPNDPICQLATDSPCGAPTKGRYRYCCSSADCAVYPDTKTCTESSSGKVGICK